MPLGRQLIESIQSGHFHIDQRCDDVNVVVDVETSDRLAMLVRRIYVQGSKDQTKPFLLKKKVQALINRLTYLDSTLRLIEWDQISNAAQIRGRPDAGEGRTPQYFEIIIDGYPSISLLRRSATETIPFHISNECFVRLIEEMVRILRT